MDENLSYKTPAVKLLGYIKKKKFIIALAIILIGLFVATRFYTSKHSTDTYPVWWSSELGLNSLTDIDSSLEESFPGDHPELISPFGDAGVVVSNCRELLDYLRKGYQSEAWGIFERRSFEANCRAIELLKTVKQPSQSFLYDFQLNAATVDLLPPTVGFSIDEGTWDSRHEAANRGMSWKDF
ncbi:MAG: hypothetical protein Q8Q89_00855, partial [bacterium]|nr:hypothetical protein [bacterium]